MNIEQIKNHIKERQEEFELLIDFWNKFNGLNDNNSLKKRNLPRGSGEGK